MANFKVTVTITSRERGYRNVEADNIEEAMGEAEQKWNYFPVEEIGGDVRIEVLGPDGQTLIH